MTRTARLWLRRLATGFAAAGGVLLLVAPMSPLAEGAPVNGLRNTLFWRGPIQNWAVFVLAALLVIAALALWDSRTRWRLLGPLLLAGSGAATALHAGSLLAGDLLERCNWGYPNASLTPGSVRPCVGLDGRYEPAAALGVAMLGGTLLMVAAAFLALSRRYSPQESERRRLRIRSFSYM